MINREGSVIHIDFGYFLSNAPGGSIQIEKNVPFKFVNEYIEVLGGHKSALFRNFRKLFFKFSF